MNKLFLSFFIVILSLPLFSIAQEDTVKIVTNLETVQGQGHNYSASYQTYKEVVINSIRFIFEKEMVDSSATNPSGVSSSSSSFNHTHKISVTSPEQYDYKSLVAISTEEWGIFTGYPISQKKVQEYFKKPMQAVLDMARTKRCW